MRYIVMAMILVLTCLGLSTAQAATSTERESLRGLPGVEVVIEGIKPDVRADGLSEEAVRTAVELILRSSGIQVLTRSDRLKPPSSPYLYVNVVTHKDGPEYAYVAAIELRQQVSLVHRPQHAMYAPTWEDSSLGMAGKNKLRDIISASVEPSVKAFANDFLAVNPR